MPYIIQTKTREELRGTRCEHINFGEYFLAPGQGTTPNRNEAYVYNCNSIEDPLREYHNIIEVESPNTVGMNPLLDPETDVYQDLHRQRENTARTELTRDAPEEARRIFLRIGY